MHSHHVTGGVKENVTFGVGLETEGVSDRHFARLSVSIGNQSRSTDKSIADTLLCAQEGAVKDKKATGSAVGS